MSSDSDIIYHYCSLDAFVNIVKSKSIRLTNIFYMNDSEEHYWLRKIAREVAEEARNEAPEEWPEGFVGQLFPDKDATDIYCACFSKDGDSLAQWRAYADDGRGVAIGFSRKALDSVRELFLGLEMRDVVYSRDEQKEIVRNLIQEEIAAMRGTPVPSGHDADWYRHLSEMTGRITTALYIWREAARCKNPAFAEEKEVRLVYHPSHLEPGTAGYNSPSSICIRARNDLLISYYSLPLTDLPIREVRFGPKSDFKRNRPAAQIHLAAVGYKKNSVELSQSTASYR